VAARGLKGGGSSFVHLPRYPDLRGTGDENEPLHRCVGTVLYMCVGSGILYEAPRLYDQSTG
jgi:hypothetical protein